MFVLWAVTLCGPVGRANVSEEHTAFILTADNQGIRFLGAEDGNIYLQVYTAFYFSVVFLKFFGAANPSQLCPLFCQLSGTPDTFPKIMSHILIKYNTY
jgi:hypothetical protein